jgi:anaerobic dimethyl sulfoxide reductase subunit B (iron-sulfur subunit)
MTQLGFLLDTDRCIGCHACRVACEVHNATPPGASLRLVTAHESGAFPDVVRHHLSIACNHCERPACVGVCPTAAIEKRAGDGVVAVDPERCNGCGRCVGACPYGAPRLDTALRRVWKCDLCAGRRAEGLDPACVETCVGGALRAGPLDRLVEAASGRAPQEALAGFPDPAWTRPSIRFLPPRRPAR